MTPGNDTQRVLITGANGQDGMYLVQRLAAEGHDVHGMCHSTSGADRLRAQAPEVTAHSCDLSDPSGIVALIEQVRPSVIYNLAGNTSVARSWDYPAETADVLGVGPVRLLQAAWALGERTGETVRFVQASSAEIFGDATDVPQTEQTLRDPVTPYGAAKSFAHEMINVYRKRGMFASSAILYNHESPTRPEAFVARKISREVARISLGLSDHVVLGNIDVYRDWGYAPDYVDALVRISRADIADDFIVATGVAHSVRNFVETAFAHIGVTDSSRHVVIDPAFYRPADPKELVGDPRRLKALGWAPTVNFDQLVKLMVDADIELLRQ
ncbi:GDP-mannose 4,6-dehydratase [Cryobacterium sp. Y11]|uniref:GDP-mannose 4,6-dehydratase n=1 Tax=Cryobacterium sp. Y11 TaxID=2045016 RepID=UPI000CE30DDD|nr:GDP-mannose 4,6-dehydratase [Cryobacterium sp. Y11]